MKPLNKKVCECGKAIIAKNLVPPLKQLSEVGLPNNFYGGNVKYVSDYRCECKKEYHAFVNKKVEVIDIANKEEKFKKKVS